MSQELIDAVNELTTAATSLLASHTEMKNTIESQIAACADSEASAAASAASAAASAIESDDYVSSQQYITTLGGATVQIK